MTDIKAHVFPFSVDKEGPINTKQYFKYEKNGQDEHYETIVMGRKLVGRAVALNDKTQCTVCLVLLMTFTVANGSHTQ